MIEESARVVRIEGDQAWVETQRQSACGQCSVNKGCGTSVLGKVLGQKRTFVRAANPIGAQLGEEVVVGLGEDAFVRGSLAVYAVPLFALLFGAILGQWLGTQFGVGDPAAIGGGLAGLGLGFGWLRLFARRVSRNPHYQPVILRRIPSVGRHTNGVFSP